VKDNLDIEELFRSKFENFEGEINPEVWSNISSAVGNSATVVAKTGLSLLSKGLIIGSAAIVSAVVIYSIAVGNENNEAIIENSTAQIGNENPEKITAINLLEESVADNIDLNQHIENVEGSNVKDIEEPIVSINPSNGVQVEVSTEETNAEVGHSQNEGEVLAKGIDNDKDVTESNSETAEDSKTDETTINIETVKVEDNEIAEEVNKAMVYALESKQDADNALIFNFKSNASNYKSVEWYFGDGEESYDLNPKHKYNNYGIYTVQLVLIDLDGIKHIQTETVKAFEVSSITVPNTFTPNNNNINDLYSISSKNIESLAFKVYDQNYKLVYQSDKVDFKWDGYDMSGNKLENGTYIYRVTAVGMDERSHKKEGSLTIQ